MRSMETQTKARKKAPSEGFSVQDAAYGFERYTFGPDFVLGVSSWEVAARKVENFLRRRRELSPDTTSYYGAGINVLWREYQLLFMIQFLEFRLAELISDLATAEQVKAEYIERLRKSEKADAERVKKPRRLMSPASLLVDFGFTLGGLVNIIRNETLDFERKSDLIAAVNDFVLGRNDFIHRSFSGKRNASASAPSQAVAETLALGNRVLSIINTRRRPRSRSPAMSERRCLRSGRS